MTFHARSGCGDVPPMVADASGLADTSPGDRVAVATLQDASLGAASAEVQLVRTSQDAMRPEVQRLNVTADRVALETQRVQLVATTDPPGGEFELTVTFGDGSTAISEAVSADASAEDVRGALQALGVGPVKVTRARERLRLQLGRSVPA